MNKQDIETRLFQKSAHIKEGCNALENLIYFREHGGVESNKQQFQKWLITQEEQDLQIGLTLMPLKVLPYAQRSSESKTKTTTKVYRRHVNQNELHQAGNKFADILNKLVFKNAYKRYNKRLFIVMVVEGVQSQKDLHLHFAMNKPEHLSHIEFGRVIKQAIEISRDFCVENHSASTKKSANVRYHYKAEVVDSGWISYITKELDTQHTHNLYLP